MSRIAVAVAAGTATLIAAASPARAGEKDRVERGRTLVNYGGCNDCHTPWKLGPNGPELDSARLLSGHPESLQMPAAPRPAMPWAFTAAGTMTAWAGPWGVSFTANLTPDKETGLGSWTEKDFIETLRSGRHLGRGRQILPPMPVQNFQAVTDEDLKAIFAYLRSIPPVKNRVPQPLPPAVAER